MLKRYARDFPTAIVDHHIDNCQNFPDVGPLVFGKATLSPSRRRAWGPAVASPSYVGAIDQ